MSQRRAFQVACPYYLSALRTLGHRSPTGQEIPSGFPQYVQPHLLALYLLFVGLIGIALPLAEKVLQIDRKRPWC